MHAKLPIAVMPIMQADEIRIAGLRDRRASFEEVEQAARLVQRRLWEKRNELWEGSPPDDPIDVLRPEIALWMLGYEFRRESGLGWLGAGSERTEAAGYVDSDRRYVGVSNQFSQTTQNFTAAHELGHVALHNAIGLHRDRALDGSPVPGARARVEVEADKFATYFLMPKKLVRKAFQQRFSCNNFAVTSTTAFALINGTVEELKKKCRSRRELARELAAGNRYMGVPFISLAERFSVSNETMAIRLEELDLL